MPRWNALVTGKFEIERRQALRAAIRDAEGETRSTQMAVNDVAVHKGGVARVIRVNVFIQGDNVGPYSADGIIVATPTGSTAYSLSAGGPIVVPGVEAIIVTPIAAHTLAVRPLVVPATYRIVIEPMAGWSDDLLVSFDGQTGTTLGAGRVGGRVPRRSSGLPHPSGRRGLLRAHAAEAPLGRSVRETAGLRYMLTELRVRDLATIADVTLQLGPGLNVLTGETGAGKSMLVDALALLLGERAAGGSVRPGAAKSVVEGAFEGIDAPTRRRIEELGLDVDDGRVVVRREVSAEGRSRAWVNGSPTTAAGAGAARRASGRSPRPTRDPVAAARRSAARHPRCLRPRRGRSGPRWPRRMPLSPGFVRRSRVWPLAVTRCAAGPTTCGTWWPRSTRPGSSRARMRRSSSKLGA